MKTFVLIVVLQLISISCLNAAADGRNQIRMHSETQRELKATLRTRESSLHPTSDAPSLFPVHQNQKETKTNELHQPHERMRQNGNSFQKGGTMGHNNNKTVNFSQGYQKTEVTSTNNYKKERPNKYFYHHDKINPNLSVEFVESDLSSSGPSGKFQRPSQETFSENATEIPNVCQTLRGWVEKNQTEVLVNVKPKHSFTLEVRLVYGAPDIEDSSIYSFNSWDIKLYALNLWSQLTVVAYEEENEWRIGIDFKEDLNSYATEVSINKTIKALRIKIPSDIVAWYTGKENPSCSKTEMATTSSTTAMPSTSISSTKDQNNDDFDQVPSVRQGNLKFNFPLS